jgi:hypothetical protein
MSEQDHYSKTRAEFRAAERLSKSTFYDLRKRKLGPEEYIVPGTKTIRITPEAHAAWRKRMIELTKTKEAQLEAERRRAQTVEAGRLAAESDKHISKRRRKSG